MTAPADARWMIDESALARLGSNESAEAWAGRIERGLARITTVTLLEVGYSAHNASEVRAGVREPPIAAMPVEYATPTAEDRAVEVLICSPTAATTARHPCPTS